LVPLRRVFVVNNVSYQPGIGSRLSRTRQGDPLAGRCLRHDRCLDAVGIAVFATSGASQLGWTKSWYGRAGTGVLALIASLVVAAAYHLGYPEFRNSSLVAPIIGNGVMSLASLLTMSPVAAIGSHVAMHIAAILHGAETTLQLPPHY
jgi:hypothetical protein